MKLGADMYHLNTFDFQKKWAQQLMGGQKAHPKSLPKMPRHSQAFHVNLTYKQFEKRSAGRVFFTVIYNHLTSVLSAIESEGECPPPRRGGGGAASIYIKY